MSRVLVVDDNAENVYLLQAMLQAGGHEVTTASNGREALEKARRSPPELIVTDILMPVMDGFSLCRQWRSDGILRSIPFIFYTATYTDPRDREFALSLGADRFVVKPQDPGVLRGIIEETMRGGAGRKARGGEADSPGETVFLQEYNQTLIRKLEAKLLQLEEANRNLAVKEFAIASAASGILLADLSGTLSYANGAAAALWGWPDGALAGRSMATLAAEAADAARLMEALSREGLWSGDLQARRADGTTFTAHVAAHRVTDTGGTAVGIMASCLDVTEQLRMREALLRAQKMESLSLFAAGIAHDFNNLLTGLFAGLELMKDALPETGPARDQFQVALSVFSRARELTQRLLAFSKGGTPARKRVAVDEVVRESCAISLSGSPISCEVNVEAGLWPVEADAGQMSQLFNNIILNAKQAMADRGRLDIEIGNLRITEGSAVMPPPGDYVTARIRDTGPGIPRELVARIFDPFFTTKKEGSGLGLATSYAIVKSHGGHIEAFSREGNGATFQIWLPALRETGQEEGKGPVQEPARGEGRILLMDDEESILTFTKIILGKAGYEVSTASCGEEALPIFRQAAASDRPIDLAILDLTIRGGMGGEETLAAIRSIDPHAAAIASTGYSDQEALSRARRQGFLGLLPKPYLAHEMLSTVKAAIGASGNARAGGRGEHST